MMQITQDGLSTAMHEMIRLHHCRSESSLATMPRMQTQKEGTPAFLSRHEVSELFGVSVSTVTRWARQGLLKTLRTPGGHYRFPAEETRRAAQAGISETMEITEEPT
jgi:excisionase family DNA binding protein